MNVKGLRFEFVHLEPELSIGVSVPLRKQLERPWHIGQITDSRPAFLSWDHLKSGRFSVRCSIYLTDWFSSWQCFKLNVFFHALVAIILKIVGILPAFSFRAIPAPPDDIKKEVPADTSESPKQCPQCLGRDTIATAAARVGPAVVNLSIPQGMLHPVIFCYLSRRSPSWCVLYYFCISLFVRFPWHDHWKEYRIWNYHQQWRYDFNMCSCCGWLPRASLFI